MFARIEALFASAVKQKHGHTVRLTLITLKGEYSYNPIWHIIESNDRGPCYLSNGWTAIPNKTPRPISSHWKKEQFLELTEARQLEVLLENYEDQLEKNREIFTAFAIAEDKLSEREKELLSDLRLRKHWGDNVTFKMLITWRGYGDNLKIGNQFKECYMIAAGHKDNNTLEDRVLKKLRLVAGQTARNQKCAERGYILDIPLQRLIAEMGYTEDNFLAEMEKQIIAFPEMNKGTMQYAGRSIGITVVNGEVKSQIAINDDLSWSKGCLTARGVSFPDTIITAIIGEPLRKVVDHPWLEGLAVTGVTQSKGQNGQTCATFMTKVA